MRTQRRAPITIVSIPVLTILLFTLSTFAQQKGSSDRDRIYPPLVFTGKAWLDCSISSTAKGRQILTTVSGQGFVFDAAMLPIDDGKVFLKKPGMSYEFTAFPTEKVQANFRGLGQGTITEMRIEVEVDVKSYSQPAGPGTKITFLSKDIGDNSSYVELTGVFVRSSDRKHFPFRVMFGEATSGSGEIIPTGKEVVTGLKSKVVRLGTARMPVTVTTVMYEAEDDVRTLK